MKRKIYIELLTKDLDNNLKSSNTDFKFLIKLLLVSFLLLISVLFFENWILKIHLHPMRFDFAILYFIFFLGIYGIFFKSSPGQNMLWIFAISSFLLLLRIVYIFFNFSILDIQEKEFFQFNHSFCPAHFLIYGVPLIFVFFYLLKSKLNTQIHYSVFLSILTAASLSELILNFFCTDHSFSHIGVWHLLSWSIPALVGAFYFRKNLEW